MLESGIILVTLLSPCPHMGPGQLRICKAVNEGTNSSNPVSMDLSLVDAATYVFAVIFLIIALYLSCYGDRTEGLSSQCHLKFIDSKNQYQYDKSGGVIIGGLFSVMWMNYTNPSFKSPEGRIFPTL